MILYTINGSGSDSVKALAKFLHLDLEDKPRNEYRSELEAVNPRATVPTFVQGEQVVTETATILRLLAKKNAPALLGESDQEEVKVDELIGFLSTTVYGGYLLRFRPDNYVDDEAHFDFVKAKSTSVIEANLDQWEDKLNGSSFLVSDKLTIADFYAYVLLKWQNGIQALSPANHPKLSQYWNVLKSQPCFA